MFCQPSFSSKVFYHHVLIIHFAKQALFEIPVGTLMSSNIRDYKVGCQIEAHSTPEITKFTSPFFFPHCQTSFSLLFGFRAWFFSTSTSRFYSSQLETLMSMWPWMHHLPFLFQTVKNNSRKKNTNSLSSYFQISSACKWKYYYCLQLKVEGRQIWGINSMSETMSFCLSHLWVSDGVRTKDFWFIKQICFP